MKLKKVEKPATDKTKQGKRAKNKGSSYERTLAKMFGNRYGIELKRTPQSGGFSKKSEKADDFRGDITLVDKDLELKVHIEAKNQKTWKLKEWITQAENDCPDGRVPVVVFHQHNTSRDYVCIPLSGFFEIVPKDNIVQKKGV